MMRNENVKKTLAESNRGSWFNQEQWQSNDSTSVASSLSSPLSSTKKLESSKQAFLNDSFQHQATVNRTVLIQARKSATALD